MLIRIHANRHNNINKWELPAKHGHTWGRQKTHLHHNPTLHHSMSTHDAFHTGRIPTRILRKFCNSEEALHIRDNTRSTVMRICANINGDELIRGLLLTFDITPLNVSRNAKCLCIEFIILQHMLSPSWTQRKNNKIQWNYYMLANWLRVHPGIHRIWRTFALMSSCLAFRDISNGWRRFANPPARTR